ncbi:hypothetical protein [Streptomyces sp. NBC_00299]|uniref:hypothetical protein n=1 Tax=Streptomyces sp. NBC_00299 TaxID=2975705 RepID=UPI002E2C3EEC|nr:hypothetical protein [Streptomyces sp. NBC_00299]
MRDAYWPFAAKTSESNRASNRPKRHRAVATRYDGLAVRYEATILVAAINNSAAAL